MKFSESWLREWVNPPLSRDILSHTLTMGGLEVEELAPVAKDFSGIVIGQILRIEKHPEADRLKICKVTTGNSDTLSIVCGADNVKVGMKIPVAMINAVLPNKTIIVPATIRGVSSQGMLCSATELGLAEEAQGLLELSPDAKLGEDLRDYFLLNDFTFDVSITPNRGDCLSVRGIARDIAALTKSAIQEYKIANIKALNKEIPSISIDDKVSCPHYVGRIIRHVKADAPTPIWLKERLRRSGLRSISAIVDIVNYVMIEMGQPMHAFDLNVVQQGICVRKSKNGEMIRLLDGSQKILDNETLLIADHEKPLAIAGVMGGLSSSVTLITEDILLESAYFLPTVIARQRQYHQLNSDSAYRFERGVDPTIQREAIERATQLILEIAGGEPSEIADVASSDFPPKINEIFVASEKIYQVLGIKISDNEIETIFHLLNFKVTKTKTGWTVSAPAYRFDINLAEDVIEELARLHGYDNIPTHHIRAKLNVNEASRNAYDWREQRQVLSDLGYQEIISYSFIEQKSQSYLDPSVKPLELLNPITAEMSVMRTNLWPGLINAFRHNKSRQQTRIRLFEIGTCFVKCGKELLQQPRMGGLLSGLAYPEQWGSASRQIDFYDLKGDISQVLHLSFSANDISFKPGRHPSLHPGQAADIYHKEQKIGWCGAIHPLVLQKLDIAEKLFVFELELSWLEQMRPRKAGDISKFPEIRRDIAVIVNQAIPAHIIQDTIKGVAGDWLKNIFIFDVYQGKGILPDQKSIALALILQHPTRTLIDDEITELMERVLTTLKGQFGAELRS